MGPTPDVTMLSALERRALSAKLSSLPALGWGVAPLEATGRLLIAIISAIAMTATPVILGRLVGALPQIVERGLTTADITLIGLMVVCLGTSVLGLISPVLEWRLESKVDSAVLVRLGSLGGSASMVEVESPQISSAINLLRPRYWEIRMAVQVLYSGVVPTILSVAAASITLGYLTVWWLALPPVLGWLIEMEVIRRRTLAEFDVWTGEIEPQKHGNYAYHCAVQGPFKDPRIFGLGALLSQRFWTGSTAAMAQMWAKRIKNTKQSVIASVARITLALSPLLFLARLVEADRVNVAQVTAALGLLLAIGTADAWGLGQFQRGNSALQQLANLDRQLPPAAPAPAPDPTVGSPEIRFEQVSFSYPGTESLVLDGVTMVWPANTALGLVGVNGAGKTTFVKLLAGAYHPTSGRILVDGVDLATLSEPDLAAWQRRIAPVAQEFMRLPLSAGDNVELGTGRLWSGEVLPQQSPPPSAELLEVAEQAHVAEVIANLPHGWATVLDKSLPDGQDLSGGEWQRIALARSLRATQAGSQVLVLDEPAAALDVESEVRLVRTYLDLTQGLSSLIISHRFSVVRPVPRILVLDRGRLVEDGSHDELMALPQGRYRHMFGLQASRYAKESA